MVTEGLFAHSAVKAGNVKVGLGFTTTVTVAVLTQDPVMEVTV